MHDWRLRSSSNWLKRATKMMTDCVRVCVILLGGSKSVSGSILVQKVPATVVEDDFYTYIKHTYQLTSY